MQPPGLGILVSSALLHECAHVCLCVLHGCACERIWTGVCDHLSILVCSQCVCACKGLSMFVCPYMCMYVEYGPGHKRRLK